MPLRVLVVDDENAIRENLSAFLEDEGMAVIAVESGEQALERIQAGDSFDVCVMDLRLPGMDGNTAIRELHRLDPELPCLVHTGSVAYTPPMDLQALGITADRVFFKPVDDMGQLAVAIRLAAQYPSGATS